MIEFQTLLLGLVFGIGPVGMIVTPPVTTVEVQLDGATIGTLNKAPWEVMCNFGSAPLPHELVALGRDAKGKEIARIRQWVNLPKPGAEVRLVVEKEEAGKNLTAKLFWSIITNIKPMGHEVKLDGEPVPSANPLEIDLPKVDLTKIHFLTAEVKWPNGFIARAETSFGGNVKDQAATGLTAVPVILWPGEKLPSIEGMQGWFLKGNGPLKVVAVEKGDAEVVLVFDQSSKGRIKCTGVQTTGAYDSDNTDAIRTRSVTGGGYYGPPTAGNLPPAQISARASQPVVSSQHRGADRLFGIWAVRKPVRYGKGEGRSLFIASPPKYLDMDGMCTLMRYTRFPNAKPKDQALANAVATAGMEATSLNRRRAVVLLIARATGDKSSIPIPAALAYLESLNVPFLVWSPVPSTVQDDLPGWGIPEDITNEPKLIAAKLHLENVLDSQRIIWVEGSHLPSQITLNPTVNQVSLARGIFRQPRTGP